MKCRIRQNKAYKIAKTVFYNIINVFLETTNSKNRKYYYSKWVADRGDENLYTKYPLSTKSLVLDVGGYTGQFSDQIISLYNPNVVIYEPVKKFYITLKKKYYKSDSVKILNFGLSNKNNYCKVRLLEDGTSIYREGGEIETIRLIDAAVALKKYKTIDLISINIEGAEYDVVERIIDKGIIKRIKNIQIQFHRIVPNCDARRQRIIRELRKTHQTRFSYPFVWESFVLKNKF